MFENTDLDYYYTLAAPSGGGETDLSFVTNHTENDLIKAYYLNKDSNKGPLEFFAIYPDGLVIFTRTQPLLIELYSNKEFEINDDGNFVLISN